MCFGGQQPAPIDNVPAYSLNQSDAAVSSREYAVGDTPPEWPKVNDKTNLPEGATVPGQSQTASSQFQHVAGLTRPRM